IALALAAKDIRMEAPIPGKSLIGIEVPNDAVSMVSFREVIEATPAHPENLLEVPLGRDISGKVQTADLTKMPHLLVAGSTGSGKSVAINGIITSILMQAKPHEVKMMMVDPKMVELNVYNGIPHLLTPVVTNPRKAAQALQKVVKEMEERYEKFAATGVRNITGYNEMIAEKNRETGEKHPILPFIVVIVDELADLMMVASNEVEDAIIRLAQMARAAGIHMILATQRPSVDVITGIIKANVPSRMAFAVSSGTDSRTIIDSNGAEKLLGRGDMLFLPMGENKPIRVQGAFISDHDVESVVEFVTEQQGANYEEKMMVTEEDVASGGGSEPQDELYDQAKDLVIEMQTASVSLLQRRFRIGYNRAARLVDELEANGVVGPSEGSKPRKVLLAETPEYYEEIEEDR
ncbi:MAG TPA: DNA translocase FtsK, partial [Enterococcus sp.]|nr:DNA translocase FtsK [Enterococcus sp.]